jgi:outer membrane protein OmpA-like peptidoglycan-associated protein
MKASPLMARVTSVRGFLPALIVLVLAACASTPPPTPVSAPAQAPALGSSLAALGFERTDDGYVLNLPGPLLFETGSDVLNEGAKSVLAKLAADLRALSIDKLRLFGHTDNVGTAEFNRNLSTRRAEAVAVAMTSHGFAGERIERRGFGFDRPIASNDTAEGRSRNRRVAVIVPFE